MGRKKLIREREREDRIRYNKMEGKYVGKDGVRT